MRTTVDLDPALLKRLRIEARQRGVTVKELLATLLRRGLDDRPAPRKRYRMPRHALGIPRIDPDKALHHAAALEDEEILRELALRK